MATLYELKNELQTVLDGGFVIDEESGEILFDSENLEKLKADYEEKLEACGLYVKNLESDAKAIRAEETALAERRRVMENKARRLREYILLNIGDGEKLQTPRVAIAARYSEAVQIDSDAELTDEYCRIKREPNKTAIKEALKAGIAVPGASIIKNRSLQLK